MTLYKVEQCNKNKWYRLELAMKGVFIMMLYCRCQG